NLNNFNRAAAGRNGTFNQNARSGTWQHDPAHRGGTPYGNRATADRFGGTTRGDSLATRQSAARQQLNRQGGQVGTRGAGDRRAVSDLGNRGGGFDRSSGFPSGGDRIGSQDLSRAGGGSGAFGGGSRGFDGGGARSDFNRGSSSFGGGGFGGG